MKHSIKYIFVFVMLLLVGANVCVFISGINLSDDILSLEAKTKKLHQQNIDLENKAITLGSLTQTASEAAALGYTQNKNTLILRSSGVASRTN